MSQPITWRNLTADVGNPIASLQGASTSINNAFSTLQGLLNGYNNTQDKNWEQVKTNNTNALMQELAMATSPEDVPALRAKIGESLKAMQGQVDGNMVLNTMQGLEAKLQDQATKRQVYNDSQEELKFRDEASKIRQGFLGNQLGNVMAALPNSSLPERLKATLLAEGQKYVDAAVANNYKQGEFQNALLNGQSQRNAQAAQATEAQARAGLVNIQTKSAKKAYDDSFKPSPVDGSAVYSQVINTNTLRQAELAKRFEGNPLSRFLGAGFGKVDGGKKSITETGAPKTEAFLESSGTYVWDLGVNSKNFVNNFTKEGQGKKWNLINQNNEVKVPVGEEGGKTKYVYLPLTDDLMNMLVQRDNGKFLTDPGIEGTLKRLKALVEDPAIKDAAIAYAADSAEYRSLGDDNNRLRSEFDKLMLNAAGNNISFAPPKTLLK